MNEQYTLIFILPFCIEMIVIQFKNNKYEIYDRLSKTINLEEDFQSGILSKKSTFKILNILYGYRNILSENRIEDNIRIVTDGITQLDSIDNLYGGIDKLFGRTSEVMKSTNKSYLIFLFFMDILSKHKNNDCGIIRFENNNLKISSFRDKKLNNYNEIKMYNDRLDDIFRNRENHIKSIVTGIQRIINLKNIDINNEEENNIFVMESREIRPIKKIFKHNTIDAFGVQKVLKKIGNMKTYEIKNIYNMTDSEVYQFLKMLAIFDLITQDNDDIIQVREFNLSWYFTRAFIIGDIPEDKDKYYEFLYRKFIRINNLKSEYIKYLNKIVSDIVKEKDSFSDADKRKYILMKIAIICIIEEVSKKDLEKMELNNDDYTDIANWIDLLKLEELLIKKDLESLKEKRDRKSLDSLFCIIYYLIILRKNNVKVNKKVSKKSSKKCFDIKVKKKDISIFEQEVFNTLKDNLNGYEDEEIIISLTLGG